jgi:hypothetical protein
MTNAPDNSSRKALGKDSRLSCPVAPLPLLAAPPRGSG